MAGTTGHSVIYEVKTYVSKDKKVEEFTHDEGSPVYCAVITILQGGMIPTDLRIPVEAESLEEAFEKYDEALQEFEKKVKEKQNQSNIQLASEADLSTLSD